MSIICCTESGWFLSHENYVNKVYEVVNNKGIMCRYRLNPMLFKIENAFSKAGYSKKRKRESVPQNFENLLEDINTVKQLFHAFKKEMTDLAATNKKTDTKNSEAASAADDIYKKSGKVPVVDIFGENIRNDAIIVKLNSENYIFPPNCKFYCKDISKMGITFDNNKFDLILLDPPWWNKYVRRKKSKNLDAAYAMMYTEDLKQLPLETILNNDGLVVVWCTNSHQHQQILLNDIFVKWNVKLLTKWYWIKITCSGEPVCGFSAPPGKQPFEQILIAGRSACLKAFSPKLIVSIPSALHSHKPPLVEVLKEFLPSQPDCLEIFARYLLPGWTSWGLEAIRFQHESLYIEE